MQVRVENFEKVFYVVVGINPYTPHYTKELCVLPNCRNIEKQQIQGKKKKYIYIKKNPRKIEFNHHLSPLKKRYQLGHVATISNKKEKLGGVFLSKTICKQKSKQG